MKSTSYSRLFCVAVTAFVMTGAPASATTIELLTNGGFETGMGGWGSVVLGSGGGVVMPTNAPVAPYSGRPTAGPAAGNMYLITGSSTSSTPGTALGAYQMFTASPVAGATYTLSFDMFVDDWGATGGLLPAPAPLNGQAGRQFASVDIISPIVSPITSTAWQLGLPPGAVTNFYVGVDSPPGAHPYTSYSFDITSLVMAQTYGNQYALRFAAVDSVQFLHMGVDNVSITMETAAVPEPASLTLLGLGLLGLGARRFRKGV